jgi:hypothetical protein
MPKSRKRKKNHRPLTALEVLVGMLVRHGSPRPEGTLGACLRNGLAAYAEPGEVRVDGLKHFPINLTTLGETLICGWDPDPEWNDADDRLFTSVLQAIYSEIQALPLLPPAYPERWEGDESTEVILWAHLDYLGWRGIACLGEKHAWESSPVEAYYQAQIQGMRLLLDVYRLQVVDQAGTHAFDKEGLLRDFLRLIGDGHRWITSQATKEAWPEPVLPPVIAPTPPDGPSAYAALHLHRPYDSALEWVRLQVHLHLALDPHWAWVPSLDGREAAISLFDGLLETTEEETLWGAETTAQRTLLVQSMYDTLDGTPVPPPLPLSVLSRIDCGDARLPRAALDHLDRLQAAFLALMMEGWLTLEPTARTKDRRLLESFRDGFGLISAFLQQWGSASVDARRTMAEGFIPIFTAQYHLMRDRLQRLPDPVRVLFPDPGPLDSASLQKLHSFAEKSP